MATNLSINSSDFLLWNASISFTNRMPIALVLYGSFFYVSIFIIGVCGNLLVIYVLMKDKELRNFTNYLLANLSVADLMVLFTNVPSGLHDLFAKERWYLGKLWCYLIAFIENTMGFASILSIFFITCDRYYVICRPLNVKSVMTEGRTLKLILFIWLVSITINLPFIFWAKYELAFFNDNRLMEYKCYTGATATWSVIYMIANTFAFYVVIGIILILMYYKISKSLNKSAQFLELSNVQRETRRASNAVQQQTEEYDVEASKKLNCLIPTSQCHKKVSIVSFQSSLNKRDPHLHRHIKKRRQLIFMLMCVLFSFYFCLFPLKIWNLVLMFSNEIKGFYQFISYQTYWFINISVRIFFYLNSSINPILYNHLSKKFRNSFKRLLLFRLCFPKHMHLEYQTSCTTTNRSVVFHTNPNNDPKSKAEKQSFIIDANL